MTERDFIYWLQGFLEVADPETIDSTQVKIIKDHIKLVMNKVTPSRQNEPITFVENPTGERATSWDDVSVT